MCLGHTEAGPPQVVLLSCLSPHRSGKSKAKFLHVEDTAKKHQLVDLHENALYGGVMMSLERLTVIGPTISTRVSAV